MRGILDAFNISVVALGGIFFLVFIIWPELRQWWQHRKNNLDEDWRLLNSHLDMVHRLFGNETEFRSVRLNNTRQISIKCRKCGKMNRLVKGFRGAACGKCRVSLVVKSAEEKRAN